jgi:hypothetical protein
MPIPRSDYSSTLRKILGVFIVALFAVIILNLTAIIVILATSGWKVFVRMSTVLSVQNAQNIPSIPKCCKNTTRFWLTRITPFAIIEVL